MADRARHVVAMAELQPAALVVLETVTGAFYLDHPVSALLGPELDKVGHAGAIGADILQQPLEPGSQVDGRQAVQGLVKQGLGQQRPVDEGALDALLAMPGTADAVLPGIAVQLGQAALEQRTTPVLEVWAVQVGRGALEWVKEGAGQGRENGVPAEQAEQ